MIVNFDLASADRPTDRPRVDRRADRVRRGRGKGRKVIGVSIGSDEIDSRASRVDLAWSVLRSTRIRGEDRPNGRGGRKEGGIGSIGSDPANLARLPVTALTRINRSGEEISAREGEGRENTRAGKNYVTTRVSLIESADLIERVKAGLRGARSEGGCAAACDMQRIQ